MIRHRCDICLLHRPVCSFSPDKICPSTLYLCNDISLRTSLSCHPIRKQYRRGRRLSSAAVTFYAMYPLLSSPRSGLYTAQSGRPGSARQFPCSSGILLFPPVVSPDGFSQISVQSKLQRKGWKKGRRSAEQSRLPDISAWLDFSFLNCFSKKHTVPCTCFLCPRREDRPYHQ